MNTRLALLIPLLALLTLGPATAPAQPPAAPPAKAAGLDVVPTDSFAFLTVNVAKLWDNPNFKPLRDWAGTQKAGTLERVFGVAPAEIDRVTVFAPAADPKGDFAPLFLVTTRKPYNEAKLLKALTAGRDNDLRRTGRVVEIAGDKLLHWAVLVDDQTLLFTPKHALREAAGATLVAHLLKPKKDGPFAQALADATKHDLALGVDVATFGALLRDDRLEKELVPYLALLKARTLTFAADFDKTARGYLRLSFADEAAAKRAAPVLKEAMGDLAGEMAKALDARKDRLDPLEKLFFESAITVLKGAKVESGEANVFASAEVPYQDTVAKFAAALPKSLEVASTEKHAQNNLKQLSLAMHNFEAAMGILPETWSRSGTRSSR